MQVLGAVGLDELEERVYLAVLDHPGWGAVQLADLSAVTVGEIDGLLGSLESRGLVSRSAEEPRGYLPTPPDSAIGVLLLRRQEELDKVRLVAADLAQRYRRGRATGAADLIEVVRGPVAVAERFHQLRAAVEKELVFFDKPPYAVAPEESIAGELDLLKRGVQVRSLYDQSIFALPGQMEAIDQLLAAGEQARSIPGLPTKLVICDGRTALMPLDTHRLSVDTAIVVQESALLNTLIIFFERIWQDARPLRPPSGSHRPQPNDASDLDRRILALLAIGLTEEMIGRQFDVSARTVGRRVERLMALLRVQSRFQLALGAAKRGWLDLE